MESTHDRPSISKEYIEHLRSVHFALIAASLILAFLAFSPSPSQYEEAKRQLIDIQRLDRAEVGDIVYSQYQQALRSWNHSDSVTLLASGAGAMSIPGLNTTFTNTFKPPTEGFAQFLPTVLGFNPSEPLDLPDVHSFNSLAEFRTFWDSLYRNRTINLPGSLPRFIFVVAIPRNATRTYTPFSSDTPTSIKQFAVTFSKGQSSGAKLEFILTGCKPIEKAVADLSHATCHYMYMAHWPEGHLWLALPVEEAGKSLEVFPQKPFLERNTNWVSGRFESSFALLNQLSLNLQDLHLETLRRVLETEQARKGESFEAIGIKFPSETTMWAGFIVLCGLQLYFALLLREQPLGLGQANHSEVAAWIGLYQSAAAKTLVFLTVVVLPTFAFSAIGLRNVNFHSHVWQSIGLICSAATIFTLSVLTWNDLRKYNGMLRDLVNPATIRSPGEETK